MSAAGASASWRPARRAYWRTTELAVIREHYAAGGIDACAPHLPGRSRVNIYQQAQRLGIRSRRQKLRVRHSYGVDARIDEQIRSAHQRAPERGSIQRLAERVGRPRWWVTRRAIELGLTTPRFAEPAWSADEIAVLERTANRRPETAQRALAAAGFHRTLTAVIVKRKRRDIPVPGPTGHSAQALAQRLGYDAKFVVRWIETGALKATRGERTYTIRDRDVRAFVIAHPDAIDLRKLPLPNRAWFVRMLARGGGDG